MPQNRGLSCPAMRSISLQDTAQRALGLVRRSAEGTEISQLTGFLPTFASFSEGWH